MNDDRTRRSAKQVIQDLTAEIFARPDCPEKTAKLNLIQSIAARMSWTELENQIKYRTRPPVIQQAHWYQD